MIMTSLETMTNTKTSSNVSKWTAASMLQINFQMVIFYENKYTLFDPLTEYLGSPEISILIVRTTCGIELFFLRIFG